MLRGLIAHGCSLQIRHLIVQQRHLTLESGQCVFELLDTSAELCKSHYDVLMRIHLIYWVFKWWRCRVDFRWRCRVGDFRRRCACTWLEAIRSGRLNAMYCWCLGFHWIRYVQDIPNIFKKKTLKQSL